jgi:hypothetical protein
MKEGDPAGKHVLVNPLTLETLPSSGITLDRVEWVLLYEN